MEVKARNLVVRRSAFAVRVAALQCDASGMAILGPNGAGKTTLLAGLQGVRAYAGTVERPARSAGVFAQPAVLRGTTGWNVSIVGRAVLKLGRSDADERSLSLLRAVGLEARYDSDARQLSSGERQRLALARALIVEPQALFLDEPFANIDADGRPALRTLVRAYVERTGCALVIATQNIADVVTLCRRTMLIVDGSVVAQGPASDLLHALHPYLRALADEAGTNLEPTA